MKGCGRSFYVRRDPNGFVIQSFGKQGKNDTTNMSKKVLLVCGNNLSNLLCPNCEEDALSVNSDQDCKSCIKCAGTKNVHFRESMEYICDGCIRK